MRAKSALSIFLTFCLCFCLIGCEKEDNAADPSKLQVYTSFYGVYDFVSKIGGDKIQVYNIVPTGTEPHNWEPTSGDMMNLSKGDILFFNGAGMENWVDKVKAAVENENLKYIKLSEGIELIKSRHSHGDSDGDLDFDSVDPHIWLNPINAKKEAETIKNALSAADPSNAEYYNKNYEDFSKKADELDADFRNMTARAENKTIVVAHEAYGYLCEAYGIEQIAIEGLSADSEPSPAKMAEISKFIKDNDVRYIFFERLLSAKAAEVISEETGAELLVLNPFEGLTQEEINAGADYFSVMRENFENIKKAIGR